MGTGDGTVGDLTPLLEPGAAADQCNIVLVAEGFTTAQQSDFNDLCDDFVAQLQAEPWFSVAGSPLNVYRLNVESDDAGTDDPTACGGDGSTADTYFDAQYCNGTPAIRRCLLGDDTLVRAELFAALPAWHSAAVLVNTSGGGCASRDVFWTHTGAGWLDTVIHELGHSAFGLADEYDRWSSDCASENPRTTSPEPNITRSASAASLKWKHLVTPGVPIPTMLNTDCSMCNTAPNVLSDDTHVGLFEGARYEHCDMFRPAYTCKMRKSDQDFCRVCVETIAIDLGGFIDATGTLEVTPSTLDFGEIADGLTLYLPFEVRNVRSGHPMPIDVTLAAPTGPFTYALGTELSFTLPAPVFESYSVRRVYVAFTASVITSPTASGELVVSAGTAQETVSLEAISIPPRPVDSVLVIDRSGSMSDPTGVPGQEKIDHAIEAGELYVSLLRDTDQIGIVRYNDTSGASDRLLTMRTAGPVGSGAGRQDAADALDVANLSPTGATSIGAGIINGSDLLDTGSADARALVVLTDGRHNAAPSIATGQTTVQSQSPAQRVFAVGLGLNQLQSSLSEIASVTNGVAQVTGDLVDEREFLLQKLYVQILSDVADEAFVRDPVDALQPGQSRATQIFLSELDVACDFIVTWRRTVTYPKYLKIRLVAPDGTIIEPNSSLAAVEYHGQSAHAYFRVDFPFDPANPGAHVGRWCVIVEAVRGAQHQAETLHYSVMAKARSNFLLRGHVVQASFEPGSTMVIVLEPTLFGQAVALDSPTVAKVSRPDGVIRTVGLTRDSQGRYVGQFDDTNLVGAYGIDTEVSATSPAGHRVTRYRHMTGVVFVPRPGGDGDTGGGTGHGHGKHDHDCCECGGHVSTKQCHEACRALRGLAAFVERCCRRAKVRTRAWRPPVPRHSTWRSTSKR